MPRRSKKSRAASQRMAQRSENNDYRSNSRPITVIRGNFHQGNLELFDAESAGRQCSCNVLVMLCIVENIFDTITTSHLDEILQIGDQIYKTRCHELEIANTLHPSKILDQTQLPDKITIGECSYVIDYKHKEFRHGRLDDDHPQSELKSWLQYTFSVSNKNILIVDGYMMAVYQHNATGQFLFFDSHSRNEIGLMTPEGTSIVLIFETLQTLLDYLFQMISSIGAKYFGIQPIVTHSNMEESDTTQQPKVTNGTLNFSSNIQSESSVNQDIPSCSTWNDHCFDPSVKSISYQKWFNSLSDERKRQRLEYMRTCKQRNYAVPNERVRKQQESRNRQRRNYAVPKRQKSRNRQRRNYAVPLPETDKDVIMQYLTKEQRSNSVPETDKDVIIQYLTKEQRSNSVPETDKDEIIQYLTKEQRSRSLPETDKDVIMQYLTKEPKNKYLPKVSKDNTTQIQ